MSRINVLKQSEEIRSYEGLAEAIATYESKSEMNFGNEFTFSCVTIDYYGFPLLLGKIDNVFFMAVKPPEEEMKYTFFKNKKHLKTYIATEVEQEDRPELYNILKNI